MAHAKITALFGTELVGKGGSPVSVDAALGGGRHVGIYFSAHWCPPCRGFTPMLADWYRQVKEIRGNGDFEVVFASSDRDQRSFDEYFAEMPWLALPYNQRELKEKLSKRFKVQGIPTLVFLTPEGKVVTTDGRSRVTAMARRMEVEGFRPTVDAFSFGEWMPKTFWQILEGATITDQKGEPASLKDMDAVGLYFSAHWCPPCRMFTPKLAEAYKAYRAKGLKFEIVFVSSDKTKEQFDEYFAEMPWKALAYTDSGRREELEQLYEIEGIPALIVVDGRDGKTITANGRAAVAADPEGNDFPWHPKPFGPVDEACVEYINSDPVFLLFPSAAAGKEDPLVAAVGAIAAAHAAADAAKQAARSEDDEADEEAKTHFLYDAGHPIVDRIVDVCKIDRTNRPTFALLDLGNGQVFDAPAGVEVTAEAIQAFLERFAKKELTARALKK